MNHKELIQAVRAARQARKEHSRVVGGDHEANNASDLDESEEGEAKDTIGNGHDDVFKDDEHILAAFANVREQMAQEYRRTGNVALMMQRVAKQLSDQVSGAATRLPCQLNLLLPQFSTWDSQYGIKLLALMTTGIEGDRQATAAGQWITSNSVMSKIVAQLHPNTMDANNKIHVNLQHMVNTFKTILK
jgi:hypothetical protein